MLVFALIRLVKCGAASGLPSLAAAGGEPLGPTVILAQLAWVERRSILAASASAGASTSR
jgi:hypothetical protein